MLSLALMGLLPSGARVSGEVLLTGSEEGGAAPPLQSVRRDRRRIQERGGILLDWARRSGGMCGGARLR
jgi:hypothetical protein